MSDVTEVKMTAKEFEQLPETNRIEELIEGELIVAPPPNLRHQEIVLNIAKMLLDIKAKNGGSVYVAPVGVYLDEHNIPEPDVVYLKPDSQAKLGKQYIEGAPELVVEVHSPSTARHDKGAKFHLYDKHGILEYWMIDPESEYIEVWQREEKLERLGVFAPDDKFLSNVLNETIDCKAIFAE